MPSRFYVPDVSILAKVSSAMDVMTLSAYDGNAAELAARYASADVSSFHRILLAHLPPGGRGLEIGCGSGRDAAFLASYEFRVVATHASSAILDAFRLSAASDLTVSDYPDIRGTH